MLREGIGQRSIRRTKPKARQTSTGSRKKKLLIALGAAIAVVVAVVVITTMPDRPRTYATIETEKGNLVLELFANDVPRTVNNFVSLAREGVL